MTTNVGFIGAFAAGLVSFFSPCILPLIPVYLAYLAGVTYNDLQEAPRRLILGHALMFILGFTAVFVALGATATFLGRFLLDHQPAVEKAAGALLLLFGLWMLGLVKIAFLWKEARWHLQEKPAGYLGSSLVGATFAAGWTPCVGPVLTVILLYAGAQETVVRGMALLAVYSLGMALPLFLCAMGLERSLALIKKAGAGLLWVERAAGACLVLIGILLLSGAWARFSNWALSRSVAWL